MKRRRRIVWAEALAKLEVQNSTVRGDKGREKKKRGEGDGKKEGDETKGGAM